MQAFSSAQNEEPSGVQVCTNPIPPLHRQYFGVQQPSERKTRSSVPSQRLSQSGSGYGEVVEVVVVVVVEVEVLLASGSPCMQQEL